jgi:hypothetical protein
VTFLDVFADELLHEWLGEQRFDTAIGHREAGVASCGTRVQGISHLSVHLLVAAQPDAPTVANYPITQSVSTTAIRLNGQLRQFVLRDSIRLYLAMISCSQVACTEEMAQSELVGWGRRERASAAVFSEPFL